MREREKRNSLCRAMARKPDPVRYILRVMQEKRLSLKDVSRRAAVKGHRISEGYIHSFLTGQADNPTIRFVRALAAGLNRPLDEVAKAFGLVKSVPATKRILTAKVAPSESEPFTETPITRQGFAGFVPPKKPSKKNKT